MKEYEREDFPKQLAVRLRVGEPPEVVRDFVPSLKNLQAEIGGGLFELVARLHPGALRALLDELGIDKLETGLPDPEGTRRVVLLIDDIGRYKDLPVNEIASILYAGSTYMLRGEPYNIRGPALLLEID